MATNKKVICVSACFDRKTPLARSQPSQNPQQKTEPRLKWTKLMCFALGLANEHQKRQRKKGDEVTQWESVLEVVNDVFLQEFEEFEKAYPNGLPNANKLRTEFSDRYRGRHSSKWDLKPEQCTPEETQEMHRIADVVITTSQRLHQQGRPVHDPGSNAKRWIWYEIRISAVPKGKKKRAKESEDESDEDEDEEDPEDDAPAYAAIYNQALPPEKRARPTRNASRRILTPDDDERDDITVTKPATDLEDDEDDDAARATDENVPPETNTMRPEPITPQLGRKGSRAGRLREQLGLDDQIDQNGEQQHALALFSPLNEATGLDPSTPADYVNKDLGSAIDATTGAGEPRPLESLNRVDQQNLDPVNNESNPIMYDHDFDVPCHDDADALNDQYKRRAAQNVANANARTRLTTAEQPPTNRCSALLVPARGVYYGDGHTEAPPLYNWKECKHTLIRGYQAGQWDRTWEIIQSVPGIDLRSWNYRTEIVEEIVSTTGLHRDEVLAAAAHALCRRSTSSLKLQRMISYPTRRPRPLDNSDDGLNFILRSIAEQPRLIMIHAKYIDFSTDQPVCNINFETDNMIDLTGSKNEEFVSSEDPDDPLYSSTGEVRRVLLRNPTTEQDQQVDLMVCDARICFSCNDASARPHFHFAYQRGQLPLVHHRDVMQPQEGDLIFCPREQGPVTGTIVAKESDIHDVVFNGNKACKAILCGKAQCPACLAEPWPLWS